ncbi:MAG: ANTAR domain-containing protein [Methylicorpusculum sp.]|uniref:ANTAR domain-containing response regulator n=1 Tax=Methylicorpusculum sp. TaxID=2713644 RepID=UPI0027288AB1|nr:ANTAR domain-containing protein [Methylicorpusculum sp.]MDO8844937.1 ANTAR domain-containing protein [Methylicorpusculum sp.]MDO8941223.1 ANTAR domain-containing protein [Methylicorpusculum sp.]MDP2179701.1 ANTAR domain-containing protein [Methylicorpusculum sp.]MDP2203870.1 ANTAR domain-containing protein [Methylicorpusculum sp.]MDP3530271.1 ANTAR domain-containing protein [Methylicorpusculum sp.]
MKPLKVLIVDEVQADKLLEHTLQKYGFEIACLPLKSLDLSAIVLSLLPDIVVLNVFTPTQAVLKAILTINQSHSVPVIIFAEDQDTETINQVIKAGVSAYIVDGLDTKRIKTIIDIAIARFKEQQALKDELKKTKSQLEERKLIDRAKGLLMKSQGYNEDEAYHALRKLAMDRNIAIGEMAKNVISMADLLK